MDAMFTSKSGRKAPELKFKRTETEEEARMRFEIEGYNIPAEAVVVEVGGQKMFVLPGHKEHPDTVVEDEGGSDGE